VRVREKHHHHPRFSKVERDPPEEGPSFDLRRRHQSRESTFFETRVCIKSLRTTATNHDAFGRRVRRQNARAKVVYYDGSGSLFRATKKNCEVPRRYGHRHRSTRFSTLFFLSVSGIASHFGSFHFILSLSLDTNRRLDPGVSSTLFFFERRRRRRRRQQQRRRKRRPTGRRGKHPLRCLPKRKPKESPQIHYSLGFWIFEISFRVSDLI
jgi:hypothetical protein